MGNKNERKTVMDKDLKPSKTFEFNQKEDIPKDAFDVKLCILGDQRVGKSNLLSKIFLNKLNTTYEETEGFKYFEKAIKIYNVMDNLENHLVPPPNIEAKPTYFKFSVWDCGGSDIYYNFLVGSLGGFTSVILIFDVTNRETFKSLDKYFDMVKIMNKNFDYNLETKFLIIGNKTDIENKIKITEDEVKNYAKQKECEYYLLSLKKDDLSHILGKLIQYSIDYYKIQKN